MRRRRFTPEFKRSIVEQLLSETAGPAELCLRYNVSSGLLFTWKKQYAQKLDELYLGREMAREDLEFLQLEGLIPGAHIKFNGTAANRIYEFQINEHLVDPSNPTAWTEAHPRPVVAAYRQTRWGTRPHFEVGPPMRGLPRPDHMNIDPTDLRIADSKYFTWWPDEAYQAGADLMVHEFIADLIDQMVRTIEKGRLVQ